MYTDKINGLAQHVAADLDNLGATGVHTTSYGVLSQLKVKRLACLVTTVMSGAATIACKRRPTYGSATGEVTIGTLTVPTLTAVGKVLNKDVTPVTCFPGEQIVFEVTSAATSGAGLYLFESEEDPEDKREQSNMVSSA